MNASASALEIRDLSIGYANGQNVTPVVRGVSLNVPSGKTMALVGESGSGKTTIAQAAMGLLPHAARILGGNIILHGNGGPSDIAALDPTSQAMRALRGGQIGVVFQEPSAALSPVYTIGHLLIETARAHEQLTLAEARARSVEMLAQTGFVRPVEAMEKYPFELSGGLRQRAMIAAALICNPTLLIADEPTSALDVTVQALLLKLVQDIQARSGMSVLLITHDLGVVATIADELTVLYRGEVMEQGSARDLLKSPEHAYLKALMAAGPSVSAASVEKLTPLRPIAPPTEEFKLRWTRRRNAGGGDALLRVTGLSKRFAGRIGKSGQTLAVNGVDFAIKQGECLGLVGESGCGKSTLCKIVMGALTPDEGQIYLNLDGARTALVDVSERERCQRLQYVFQDPFGSLNPRRTVKQALVEPFEIHAIGHATLREEWATELLALVGLKPEMLNRYPNAFSGGQRQRIAIARALALKPDLLVCDEPVSALDVSVQAQILNLLQDLKAMLGMALLFVSHNLAVVRHLADRVAVMCAGRIVEIAPKEALFANPRHPYTKALIAAVPEVNQEQKLDLSALMDGRASEPSLWDEPYRLLGDAKPRYDTVSDGHLVAIA